MEITLSLEVKIIEYYLINGLTETLCVYGFEFYDDDIYEVINNYYNNPYIIRESKMNQENKDNK